ncbi:tRNA (adenosine(37)-N6)-dimethylallyltransferase MiaA [Pelagibacteraceae bacterium]|nr:tRNA (adenosine(37)-N6)-dimethylallyltransferase MiaA [Pelagibacteraceae bacterium]
MPKNIKKKIILLFGPTASGKSRLADDIASEINAEIVNADSMQVYKEIKILSARPLKKNKKHHLYGFISVKKIFSTGSWYKIASKKIKQINKKGKIALVVGGTGLYFKTLTDGFSEIPNVPKRYKNTKINRNFILKNPKIFKGISLNDNQRLQRAYSVYQHTKKPLWYWQKSNKKEFEKSEITKIFLSPPKPETLKRINTRFELMLQQGAIKEVQKFIKKKVNSSHSSNFIIGINEITQFLRKKISLEEVKERVLIRTRQYAKRQHTWQRGQMKDWKGFYDTNYLDLRKKILTYLSKT